MNAITHITHQTFSLLEVVQLKWMLAGEGIHLHLSLIHISEPTRPY